MIHVDISDLLIPPDWSIKQALKKLDDSSRKVLFVASHSGHLLGALSDGDIRRALLSGKTLEASIAGVYNTEPHVLPVDQATRDNCRHLLLSLKLLLLPLIDGSGKIVSAVSWDSVFSEEESINGQQLAQINVPIVVMAGGKGTRMAPFTNVLPKPLIPIGEKTILELIVDQFLRAGADQFLFTINYRGEMIKAYFDSIPHDYHIQYVRETNFRGTAGCLELIRGIVKGTFIVSNCDILVRADYADALAFHQKSNARLTVISSIQHMTVPYGVIQFQEGGVVTGLIEKPEFSYPINTGVYILEPSCLEAIPEEGVFHMTDLIEVLIKSGERVCTYPVNEKDYIDIGQWDEYREALSRLGAP